MTVHELFEVVNFEESKTKELILQIMSVINF